MELNSESRGAADTEMRIDSRATSGLKGPMLPMPGTQNLRKPLGLGAVFEATELMMVGFQTMQLVWRATCVAKRLNIV